MKNKHKLALIGLFDYIFLWKRKTVGGYTYTIKNPLVFLKRSGTIKLTDGYCIPFDKENKIAMFRLVGFVLIHGIRLGEEKYRWNFDSKNMVLTTHQGIRFHAENVEILAETFLFQIHYSGFDLRDKVVVTAGAYIGDSPLSYSYYGARVIALEPDQNSFKIAQDNISLNPELATRITLLNYALGTDGTVDFPVNEDSGTSSIYRKSGKNTKIRSISLSALLKETNCQAPYLLDIDIKGSEFDVVEDPSISIFQKVRIEYSPYYFNDPDKSLQYLVQKLKNCGFKKIRIWKHNSLRFDLLDHGTLDAEK